VPQRHKWLQSTIQTSLQQIAVVQKLIPVVFPLGGLNARPLNGEAVSFEPNYLGKLQVLPVAVVMVARSSRDVIYGGCCLILNPGPGWCWALTIGRTGPGDFCQSCTILDLPLTPVVAVSSFNLMCRG